MLRFAVIQSDHRVEVLPIESLFKEDAAVELEARFHEDFDVLAIVTVVVTPELMKVYDALAHLDDILPTAEGFTDLIEEVVAKAFEAGRDRGIAIERS